jgi:hypothetical protein
MYFQRRIKMIKKTLSILMALTMMPTSYAAATVNYLNVDGDAVHFSTNEAKSAVSPSCVIAETNDRFTVSLQSEAGRAMYSLLITAMASKQAVTIESALDCTDIEGVERAKGVSIVPITVAANLEGSGKSMYLYKGDNTTKLGRIFNGDGGNNIYYYYPVDDNTVTRKYAFDTPLLDIDIYFEKSNCTGVAYLLTHTINFIRHPYHNSGQVIMRSSTSRSGASYSRLNLQGICFNNTTYSNTLYPLVPYNNLLCGNSPCIFKEE